METIPSESQFERAVRGVYPDASYLYPNGDDLEPGYNAENGLDAQEWAGQEFGDCELGDERLTRRGNLMAQAQG